MLNVIIYLKKLFIKYSHLQLTNYELVNSEFPALPVSPDVKAVAFLSQDVKMGEGTYPTLLSNIVLLKVNST